MLKNIRSTYPLVVIVLLFFSCSKTVSISTDEQNYLNSAEPISVGLFPYYPPYQFVDDQGDINGVFIDYLDAIEEKLNYKFKRVQYDDWITLVDDAKTGKLDIVLEIQKTEERRDYLNFYAELFKSAHVLVTKKGNKSIKNLSDLKNQSIAVPQGYSVEQLLAKAYPSIKLKPFKDDIACLNAVHTGEAKAYVGPKALANYTIRKLDLTDLKIVSETTLFYKPSIGVNKQNEVLNSIMNKAVKSFTLQEKQDIMDRWLYNVIYPFYQNPKFWMGVVWVFVLVVIALFLVNRYLNYKVAKRTKQLLNAKENIEESDRLKTNFIRNISHEIRTPMNGIIGFSEALKNPELTEKEKNEYLNIIINSGKELLSIIEDILEISKLRYRQITVNPEKTNLIVLIEMLFTIYQVEAKKKGLKLLLDNQLPQNQHLILIDKGKLKKIISNLLDNAIKFTEEGTIEVRCYKNDEFVYINVKDSGIGIAPKDKIRIFRSFNQSEKEISKNYGGLGLGLTIARENSVLLGGELSLESELGKGTTFKLKLPYIAYMDKENLTPELNQQETPDDKHIVLIAEDGDINFLFLQMVLQKMQSYTFTIHRAKNGQEAVALCKENNKIDLVLMDIKMPIMDGYDATKKIKKIRPELKIVAQTAYSTEEDIKRALNAGCDDFLSKPVDQSKLKKVLKEHFDFSTKQDS
ncbi:response regulator [Aquimarina brevivitae]|uniref:histidine kinase n=1 Tax=Aquimarina brevivitae TaxID=323412 RepID=A0A4Q7P0T0_9FLAO|nr:transporter substrate-binding domain-containing protein [Aquimarina brevivitae]RZS93413.1 signal transduction histidine kinase [Aquimarina brevivitae]